MNYSKLLIILILSIILLILYNYNIESYSNSNCARAYILNRVCTISLTDYNNNYNSSTINNSSIGIKIQNYTNLNKNEFYRDSLVYVGHNSLLDTHWVFSGGSFNEIKIINSKYNVYLGFGDLDEEPLIKKSVYVTSTYNKNCLWKLINTNCSVYYIKHIKTGLYLYSYKPHINNTFVDQQTPLLYYKFGNLTCNKIQQPWLILPPKPVNIKGNSPNGGNNRWSFRQASELCNNRGMQLCSSDDLTRYSKLAYSNCNCSWLKNIKGNTVNTGYGMSNTIGGCGQQGVNSCGWKNIIKSEYICDRITWYIYGDKFGSRWKTTYLPTRIPWQTPSIQRLTIGKIGAILYAVVRNAQNNILKIPVYVQLYYKGSPYTGNVSSVKLLCRGSGVTCCPKPTFQEAESIDFSNFSWSIDDQWYNQANSQSVGNTRIFPFFYSRLKNKPNGTSVVGKITNNSNNYLNTGNDMVLSGTKYNDSGYYLDVLYSNDGKNTGKRKFIYFNPPIYHEKKCSNTYFNFPSVKIRKVLKTFPKPPCPGTSNNNAVMAGAPFYKVLGSRQNCIKACQKMKNCRAATGKMVSNNINKYNKGTNYKYCWLSMKGGPGKFSTGYTGWWSWRKPTNC